jgi:hypothetical protein
MFDITLTPIADPERAKRFLNYDSASFASLREY